MIGDINTGEFIDGIQVSNVFNFWPSLPVQVGKARMLPVHPVFPILTVTVTGQDGAQDGYKIHSSETNPG